MTTPHPKDLEIARRGAEFGRSCLSVLEDEEKLLRQILSGYDTSLNASVWLFGSAEMIKEHLTWKRNRSLCACEDILTALKLDLITLKSLGTDTEVAGSKLRYQASSLIASHAARALF